MCKPSRDTQENICHDSLSPHFNLLSYAELSCLYLCFFAGCPGVLVVKRAVLPAQNSLPTEPGGGTVFYVTEEHHRYSKKSE
jgi:hypothetical protein